MADASAYVVLGIEVTKTTFFITTRAGLRCPRGHEPQRRGAKFCDEDGESFRETLIETPTPDFQAWATKLGHEDAVQLWDDLTEGGPHVKRGQDKLLRELGIHNVGSVESSERDHSHTALGFKLLDQDSDGSRGRGTNGYDADKLLERATFLVNLREELRLPKTFPVQLMLSIYWSV